MVGVKIVRAGRRPRLTSHPPRGRGASWSRRTARMPGASRVRPTSRGLYPDASGAPRRSVARLGLGQRGGERRMQLEGKVALITGASKGIGRVMSRMFAREGAAVVCAARSQSLVEETAALVKADGGRAIPVTGDAATEADVQRMIEAGTKAFGKLDTLVNNAGDGGPTKRVQEYTSEDWFYTINSCLTSSYMCIRFAVPEMIKAGGGAIVNIASVAGRRGLPYRIGYCSAKAGQVGMTFGMAIELAPHNITVNAIAPGAVAGDRIDRVIEGQAQARGVPLEEMRRSLIDRSPLKRMSTAEDIATLAIYLCSDAARNLSGQCIAVTAGEPAV
ncbi:MAG: 3-oxoacyl-[acyl-carrier-protein] reductase [Candidatus Rokuibacteriota bacterium]|nr:MAG: 3-oxoacyl-[acyl-carrier-protein] reductase [Candidatus Rokubacteria bacterium]